MSDTIINISEQVLIKYLSNTIKYLGAALFLLMLIAPFDYVAVKISIITLLVVVSVSNILMHKKINLARPVFKWFLGFISFGFFFSMLAFLIPNNQASYILRSMPVNIVWPILYCLMVPFINSESIIGLLDKIMVWSALFISIYLICATFSYLGLLPISPSFFSNVKPVVGKYDAAIQLFLPSTTSLLFLIPFLTAYLLLQIFKKDKINLIYVVAALVLGIAAIIVTARRALILNLLISPVLIYVFLKLAKVKLSKNVKINVLKLVIVFLTMASIACIILIKYEILNPEPLVQLFKDGFDFSKNSDDVGSMERAQQYFGLIHSWKDYPILGSGLGSSSEYVIRSEDTPWVYELSYLALLYQTGIVGFLIYFGLIFWIFYTGITVIRRNKSFIFVIPPLVGCFCFLLGNASNPYTVAFDHMWAIFLPVGFINFCYYNNRITQ